MTYRLVHEYLRIGLARQLVNGLRLNEIAITTAVAHGLPAAIITIDGINLLELQRPARDVSARLAWSAPQPREFLPPDPVDLLPPDSMSLLPTAQPRPAMVGICRCGVSGCDSLWLQVKRLGDEVVWEPYASSPRATIDASYVFDLRQYLDAIDAGQASTVRWEPRARLLARELRRRRDSLFGFDIFSWEAGEPVSLRLLDVTASGDDRISLTAATPNGVRQRLVPLSDSLTDDEVLNMLQSWDSGA